MPACKTCKHWTLCPPDEWDDITRPVDPDTYQPMLMPFEVAECKHPKLMFCERPLEIDGFAVTDASNYHAQLYTSEEFGCVRWEGKEEAKAINRDMNGDDIVF